MAVYAYIGSDELRRNEALEIELGRWEKSAESLPVKETHFGEDLNAELVAQSYESPDLFAPRKSLILRNYESVKVAGQKILEKALQADNPQTAVFISAEKLDGRSSFVQSLKKAGRLFEFKSPYDNEIPAWLIDRARKSYNRILSPADARLLQEIVGNETTELNHELEKLDTFLPKGKPITAEAIQDVASPLKVHAFFEFQKAAGLKIAPDFLVSLRNLLDNGTEAFAVVMRLFTHFLNLAKIRSMQDERAGDHEIMAASKVNPYIFKKERYLVQAQTRSLSRWKYLLARLARLEADMKMGRFPHRFEIEMALAGMVT